jgi:hypothetical protein
LRISNRGRASVAAEAQNAVERNCFCRNLVPELQAGAKTMRYIFVLLIASVLSILAFKYSNNSLGGGELMASPMDVTEPQ